MTPEQIHTLLNVVALLANAGASALIAAHEMRLRRSISAGWVRLAESYERLGRYQDAADCRAMAEGEES